ncbi:MAG: PH domain-containing protein [Acidobacteria bacterium]|nr:PH domain-containing protein [Acidobacteriota bacterium]
MPELKVHPSTMLAKALIAFAVILAIAIFFGLRSFDTGVRLGALIVPMALIASAVKRMVTARYTLLEMAGDRLKLETGMTSRNTRSMPLTKVQDVTVKQSLGQRILGLGDLMIETAGEAGGLTIREISSPRVVAEQILDRVAELTNSGKAAKGHS